MARFTRAHRPLGAVNRVRKAAYEMSSKLRARLRGAAIVEPVSLDALPFDQAGTGHAAAALLDTEPVAPR